MNRFGHRYSQLTTFLAALAICTVSAAQSVDMPMDAEIARAMLNRFGYGADSASLGATVGITPRHYIDRAIRETSNFPPAIAATLAASPAATPIDVLWQHYGPGGSHLLDRKTVSPETFAESRRQYNQAGQRQLAATIESRLLASANSDNPGHEILLNFWLNHFSIFGHKGANRFLAADYARSLQIAMREDSFLALLKASFLHPAMQIYLDNQNSTAPESARAKLLAQRGRSLGINENLARELLELHTLGIRGGYNQSDVQALARIITGAGVLDARLLERDTLRPGNVRTGIFHFDLSRHDTGEKHLLGQTYPAGGGFAEIERALEQLARHPATAAHLAEKLARRFLADEPPPEVINAMASAFLASGGRISATLHALLENPAFADSLNRPRKFKEPVDYILSAARASCDGDPIGNGGFLRRTAVEAGAAPFLRSTPEGYGSKESDWLSPPAMAQRIRLAQTLASARAPLGLASEDGSQHKQCKPQLPTLHTFIGPLGTNTTAALANLPPRDEITALLASPEFMRR